MSVDGSKIGSIRGSVDENLVGLTGRKKGVAFLDQEYVMCNEKKLWN